MYIQIESEQKVKLHQISDQNDKNVYPGGVQYIGHYY